jgi:NADPH:quinone reductase
VRVGDRVFGSAGHGAAREKMVVTAATLFATPKGVSDEVAASVTVTYGTGLHGLKDRGQLQPGETCVILGASGGAGLAAVELAKLMGARVVACASMDEKLAICKDHGADVLINYSAGDLKEQIRAATGGNGADVVYDCVGDKYAEPAIRAMNWGGRYLVVGFAAGDIPRIPLNLLLLKNSSLVGVFWGAHVARNPAAMRENIAELMGWVQQGKLRPHIHKVFPLEETGAAIRELDRRASTGKVIIKP